MATIFGLLLQLGSAHCLIIVAFKNEPAGRTHVIFGLYTYAVLDRSSRRRG